MTPGDDEGAQAQLARTPAEKAASAVLPAGAVVWTAAEIMHWAGTPWWQPAAGTAVVAALAWGAAGQWDGVTGRLPLWVALAGTWMTAADVAGLVSSWPARALTVLWTAYTAFASRAAHRSDPVVSAREWRAQRIDWLERCHEWGLAGSHLHDFRQTRLGELYIVNITGTGKRRSQLLGSSLPEIIARAENLDENRVRVMKYGTARYIQISVRRTDPWAGPVLHPLACDEHEVTLPERRSILQPAVVGQDPETGERLTVPLYTQAGANRVSITASSGGGKGVFEDDLFEHVTACDDAVAVHLNVSIKGHEDEESWGPACWLTAYGPAQKSRAALVLKIVADVLEWRTRNFKRGEYRPSPEHPAIIIFNDESDAALSDLRQEINTVVTKGRSHGAAYVHLGQRNTREYVDPRARSQDNVRCTGLVQNSNEAGKAGSGAGPDMSTYGEGKPGVWKVEILGGPMSLGRTWIFHPTEYGHARFVERLAQQRAHDQPELAEACLEALGPAYQALRATEVYEKWCRAQDPETHPDDPETTEAPPADAALRPAPAAPQNPAAAPAVIAPSGRTAVADQDPDFEKWLQMDVDEDTQAKLASIHEKLAGARRVLEESAARPAPVPPADFAARTAERWRQVAEQAQIPEEAREPFLALLREGTTISQVAAAFAITKWTARTWLEKLRQDGTAYVDGERRAARWRLAAPPGDGNTQ